MLVRLSMACVSMVCVFMVSLPVYAQEQGSPQSMPSQEANPPPKPLPPGVRVLEIKGGIAKPLIEKMRNALQAVEPERYPAGAIILLDSPGGDGIVAMEVGRMIRAARAHVFVTGRCASACVYLLAAGVVRGVSRDRAVGIHRARLAAFIKGIGVVDINSASNPNAAAALEAGNRQTKEYFKEMGMPDALFEAIMAAPSDQTRYLDLTELPALGLVGIDPAYRAERAPVAAAQFRIAEEEFERRTGAVPERCIAGPGAASSLVRCYRRLLATGE
jgi:ATP-dependent protease ClpP protease subunit